MPDLNKLKEKEEDLLSRLRKVQDQIEAIEENEELPALKQKYEGKYFRYRNSNGFPENSPDCWWLYIRVDKVNNKYDFECFCFQHDRDRKIIINNTSLTLGFMEDCREISKKQFDNAFSKFMKSISKMNEGELK